jgi:hypothetical protein
LWEKQTHTGSKTLKWSNWSEALFHKRFFLREESNPGDSKRENYWNSSHERSQSHEGMNVWKSRKLCEWKSALEEETP